MGSEEHCHTCDALLDGTGRCPSCGAPAPVVITPAPATLRVQGFAPSIIRAGKDPDTGDHLVRVDDPGVTSQARLTPTGQVSLSVQGATGVGRAGEDRAVKTLEERLQADGLSVSIEPGDDARGEDSRLVHGSQRYTIQLATTPGEPAFWREASAGSAMTQVQTEQAASWIRSAIEAKANTIPPAQRPVTILAIDARHAGILASPTVLATYTSKFTDPVREFGFASVWILGPTAQYCARLGDGTP